MFKAKQKKDLMCKVTDSLKGGQGMLSQSISEGIKYAGDQVIHMSKYIRKNDNLIGMRNQLLKHPAGSAMTLAGVGLIVLGIVSLIRK